MHYGKTGLRPNVIRAGELIKGELSVWRLARDPEFNLDALVNKLSAVGPPNDTLREVLSATAGAIRNLRMPELLPSGQRVFCVLDDCQTDNNGGWHSEHATIALEQIEGIEWANGTDPFDTAREGLIMLLKAHVRWPASNLAI
jgi:hypothetical protein